jgi:ABC-type phosphate transport system substrate-binding protein
MNMRSMKTAMAIIAGLASIAGVAVSAQAQTVLNVAGASAAKPFVEETPITLCNNPTGGGVTQVPGALAPRIFMDGPLGPSGNRLANSNFITWVCEATNGNVGLPSIIIRYRASGSSAGIDKPNAFPTVNNDGVTPNAVAREIYVLENTATCGAPTTELDALGRTRQFYPSCTQFSANPTSSPATALVVNMGVSDVAATSFGQVSVGYIGTTQQGSIVVGPRADSNITTSRPVVVPFSIVLGSAVKSINPATGSVIGPVRNLTQLQVEAISSRNITRWTQLNGIGADTNADGIVNASDNNTIVLCQRRAGSGTKAAFDQTLMKDASEHTGQTPVGSGSFNLTLGTPATPTAGPTTLLGIANGDVKDCLQGNATPTIPASDPFPFPGARPAHPTAFAYMEAEQAATVSPAAAYVVSVDGGKALRNDSFNGHVPPAEEAIYAGNEKENIRCGKYQYWVFEAFNTRNVPPAGTNEQILIDRFLAQAESPSIINNLPNVGRYWVAPAEMHVTKNADKGPVLWKANVSGVPACLTAVNKIP